MKNEQEAHRLKGMHRIALTSAAEDWIGEQTPEALELFNPIYVPMIVSPRPWVSLSEGGYLVVFVNPGDHLQIQAVHPQIKDEDVERG